MKNAIVTKNTVIPFESIEYIGSYNIVATTKLYIQMKNGDRIDFNSISKENRENYINWLENKDNTPISIEQNKINEFASSFKGQTAEEFKKIPEIDLTSDMEYEIKAYEPEKGKIENKIEKLVKEYINQYDIAPTHIKMKKDLLIDYAIEIQSLQLSLMLQSDKWQQLFKNINIKIKVNNIYLKLEPLEGNNESEIIVYNFENEEEQ